MRNAGRLVMCSIFTCLVVRVGIEEQHSALEIFMLGALASGSVWAATMPKESPDA